MLKSGQSSFRRILLTRILLLTVPILLIGVYTTYRKAESSLQETARQNLTESAVRKGESIRETIQGLETNLIAASQTVVMQSGSQVDLQKFIEQLAKQLPSKVNCLQITDLQQQKIVATTCKDTLIPVNSFDLWQEQKKDLLDTSRVDVKAILPKNTKSELPNKTNSFNLNSQIRLLLSAPVYDQQGKLHYVLSFQSSLLEQEKPKPGSLAGNTVLIEENGTILAHPLPNRVGRNIKNEEDAVRLESLMKNAIAGNQTFLHLFSFGKNGEELLAGYASINSPITNQKDRKWIVLAIQSRKNALADLSEIWLVLCILTLCLVATSLGATLFIAHELALPVERLTEYALNQQQLRSTGEVPHNFKIREFNQLAKAIANMVERLKTWAEELETAWKEAQTANQLKNEFLATISHELRTPLNGIIGCIRLVKDGYCDDREEELDLLNRADTATIHLLGIINDILDIAKIEAGKLSVVVEPVDLNKLLKEVIDLQVVAIKQKGLKLNVPDLSEAIVVSADPAKLKQVLLNIIGNAAKFTEKGSITITIKILPSEENSKNSLPQLVNSKSYHFSQVIITVQDTGIGIEAAQQQKLFRPFVMVDGTTTRKFGGTGLGLAISKNLIELMGGKINLFSPGEGRGTTVEIALPIIENSQTQSVLPVGGIHSDS